MAITATVLSVHALSLREKLFISLTLAALLAAWILVPSESHIRRDALENLTAAYNLSHYGVISLDDGQKREPTPEREPSLEREPLPIIVLAGYISVLRPWLGEQSIAELQQGKNARLLKYSNLLWGAVLVVMTVVTTIHLTGSWTTACCAVWFSQIGLGGGYDTLLSEIAAAALLTCSSFLLLRAVSTGRKRLYLSAGLCFGALCLTKAAFLYISAVLVLVVLSVALLRGRGTSRGISAAHAGLMAAGIAIVVLPWMGRNYVQLESFSIAGRGGKVLLTRAFKDLMTAEEYRGTFYVYAPVGLKQAIGLMAGYSKKDEAKGGRLERLNRRVDETPRDASAASDPGAFVSFFGRANATYRALLDRHKDRADAEARQQAFAIILAHPWRHAALCLPFLWRGAPYAIVILCVFVFVFGWQRRNRALVWYTLPSIGAVGFYASLTHFIPRYADPIIPVAAICFVVLVDHFSNKRAPTAVQTVDNAAGKIGKTPVAS
ncbi:MAG TPA: hypothetical protein VJU83_08735 [Burkholderiales bacterium]|nr:hypothetical protein [Burkholderiales bacterium]